MKDKGYKITEFDYKGNFLEWATWNLESFMKIVNEDLRSKGRNEFIVFVDDDYIDNELSNFDEDWDIDDEEYKINKDILIRNLNEVRGCYADYLKNNGVYIRLGTTFEEVVKSYCERINISANLEIID
ncbi:TPA: hypothetical protein RPW15_001719 [Campylobacter fetus subsp. venerealis]|uniref:Uncharacterized protein n=2 Tax=Campylobacter fetus subsp. venerealis TaxID=32020 RepID=A0AAE6IZA5_CAMFE|nr:hypothetical protein [Campylobacter fetus]OCS29008.1 hypothetical protein CFVCCUG33900_08790 [Campylobacter fetus subsp. venerealis LMG 6570 = CCUG 33900]OCS38003.1 hypothetical protein CFVI02298_10220 [Campylobacter fetus subsp. venerealis cfvi02/298]ACS15162.1 hypothetical protein [Campylobacter fetus subsp. venerealis NCTC 10354]AHE94538.1 hypothetical protein CFVI03293_1234 [Campylobacter fetus subsp. venerealis cfvi03/293]AIR80909.1 hypothetical protein CFV97608_1291 [Campylobacter fet